MSVKTELTEEEWEFCLRVFIGGGQKYACEPHYSEDGETALWVNPEKLGWVRSIGSYKFAPCEKLKKVFLWVGNVNHKRG